MSEREDSPEEDNVFEEQSVPLAEAAEEKKVVRLETTYYGG